MKKLLLVIIALAGALTAAGFAASFFIKEPAEALKAKVVANAGERIGRDVSAGVFGGNPFTGFYVKDIRIGGRAADLPDTLKLGKVKLALSFAALLKRQIVVKEISLEEPEIYLERYADGKSSIMDITDRLSAAAEMDVEEESKWNATLGAITIVNGKLLTVVHGEDNENKQYGVEKINIVLSPAGEGKYSAKASGDFQGIKFSAHGNMETLPAVSINMKYSVSEIDLKKLPAVFDEYKTMVSKLGITGQVATGGTYKFDADGSRVNIDAELKNFTAAAQDFGPGKVNIEVTPGALAIDGAVGKEGAAFVGVSGSVETVEGKKIDIVVKPSGINIEKAIAAMAPEAAKMITGTAGGNFNIRGTTEAPDDLVASGDLRIQGGDLFYPAPVIHGEGSALTAVPYESISMNIEHKKPVMKISGAKLKGAAIEGAGQGRLEYSPSEEAGEEPAPIIFSLSADLKSADVAKLLETNAQLKNMVSGAFSGSGAFRGTSGRPESYAGNFSVNLNNGKVLNPYDAKASKLPINANLSHFAFQSLKGTGKIGDETVRVDSAELRSKPLDADVSGAVTFEGFLNGHAVASVKPEILGTIENLKPLLSQFPNIAEMEKVDTSFNIGGTVNAPEVKWNGDDIARKYGKKIIEKKVDKLIDKALGGDDAGNDSVKNKLKNKLKKIF